MLVVVGIGMASAGMAMRSSPPRPKADCGLDDSIRYLDPYGQYQREVIFKGEFPLWNPYQACGLPLFAMMQDSVLYPGNWPAMLWSATGFKIGAALHIALSAIGMMVWLYSLGIQLPGALTGAILYSGNAAILNWVCTQPFHHALAWWPWLFWATERVLARPGPRTAAALGLIGALTFHTGCMQFVVYGGYGLAVYTAFRLAAMAVSGGASLGRVLCFLMIGALCVGALSAVQLLPGLEASALSPRAAGGLTVSQILFYPPQTYAGAWRLLTWPGSLGYLGTALGLGLAAVAGDRSRNIRMAFVTLALLSWALTAGSGWLFEAYLHVPTSHSFRFPSRLFTLTVFAFATLSGFAVQDALEGKTRMLVPTLLIVAGVLALTAGHPTGAWYGVAAGAALVALAFAQSLPRLARTAVACLVPMLLLVEALTTVADPFPPFDDIAVNARLHGDVIRYLQTVARESRVHLRHRFDRSLPVKTAMRYRFYADFDYEPFMPSRMASYWQYLINGDPSGKDIENGVVHLTADAANLHLLDYLSTRYIVDNPWENFFTRTDPALKSKYQRVFRARDGYSVIRNQGAMPRVSLVARAELSLPGEPLLKRLADETFPADGTVLVEDPKDVIDAPSARAGDARLVQYSAQRAEIDLSAALPGMLIFTDTFYPGWRATVDGQPAKIAQVNYLFRGVKVPVGEHVVRFEYRPARFYVGLAISLLGLVGVVFMFAHRGPPRPADRGTVGVRDYRPGNLREAQRIGEGETKRAIGSDE